MANDMIKRKIYIFSQLELTTDDQDPGIGSTKLLIVYEKEKTHILSFYQHLASIETENKKADLVNINDPFSISIGGRKYSISPFQSVPFVLITKDHDYADADKKSYQKIRENAYFQLLKEDYSWFDPEKAKSENDLNLMYDFAFTPFHFNSFGPRFKHGILNNSTSNIPNNIRRISTSQQFMMYMLNFRPRGVIRKIDNMMIFSKSFFHFFLNIPDEYLWQNQEFVIFTVKKILLEYKVFNLTGPYNILSYYTWYVYNIKLNPNGNDYSNHILPLPLDFNIHSPIASSKEMTDIIKEGCTLFGPHFLIWAYTSYNRVLFNKLIDIIDDQAVFNNNKSSSFQEIFELRESSSNRSQQDFNRFALTLASKNDLTIIVKPVDNIERKYTIYDSCGTYDINNDTNYVSNLIKFRCNIAFDDITTNDDEKSISYFYKYDEISDPITVKPRQAFLPTKNAGEGRVIIVPSAPNSTQPVIISKKTEPILIQKSDKTNTSINIEFKKPS